MSRGMLWIAGEEQASTSGEWLPVVAPVDGVAIGDVPRGNAADVDRAVQAARRAGHSWANLAAAQRERCLLAAAELLEKKGDERLLDLIIDEGGSTIRKARFELLYTADLLRTAAGEARRLYGDTFPNDDPQRLSMVWREPLGVVGVISPFNAPLALFAKMVAFPLAAGNTVVAKPSEETPLTALAFARLLHEAGLPPGALNVVTGYGGDCGVPLVAHQHVAGIAFTGSTDTGAKIAALAAPRMCRLQLELGGKNPMIVLDDVAPRRAAQLAVQGAFAHAGQICMANTRILVQRTIADDFLEHLVAQAEALHLGDLRDERTAYGPLINYAAVQKMANQIGEAVRGGARVLTGGATIRGLTMAPTVVFEPPRDSSLWREETFGPVVSVVVTEGLDAAVEAANDCDYGLSASILTNRLQEGLRAARALRAGAVHLGMHAFQSNALAPVGGLKNSGMGRSGGKYSVEHFTELKWVSAELNAELAS